VKGGGLVPVDPCGRFSVVGRSRLRKQLEPVTIRVEELGGYASSSALPNWYAHLLLLTFTRYRGEKNTSKKREEVPLSFQHKYLLVLASLEFRPKRGWLTSGLPGSCPLGDNMV